MLTVLCCHGTFVKTKKLIGRRNLTHYSAFVSFPVMSFFCPGTPSRMPHYIQLSLFPRLLCSMTVPWSFLVFDDLYRLEAYWPGVLKRAPGCGIVGCLFPHAQTGLWVSGEKGMRVRCSPHPHHYTLLFVLYCSISWPLFLPPVWLRLSSTECITRSIHLLRHLCDHRIPEWMPCARHCPRPEICKMPVENGNNNLKYLFLGPWVLE